MSATHWYRDDAGDIVEITDRVKQEDLDLSENAEEGSVAIGTVTIGDPGCDFIMSGGQDYLVKESEVASGTDTIYYGYTVDRGERRGTDPLGRQVAVPVADLNTVLSNIVLTSADANRPAETDVDRVEWVLDKCPGGVSWDDRYISATPTVAMGASDYTGQTIADVLSDCAQASGRNWFLTYDVLGSGGSGDLDDGGLLVYWPETCDLYESSLRLSNDLDDIDLDANGYPIGPCYPISDADTVRTSDPSRCYNGVYLVYDGGAVYRSRPAAVRRDCVIQAPNVHDQASAIARTERHLDDLATEDVRVTTWVVVPLAEVNGIRPGMRVPFKGTHLTGFGSDFRWCRVLNRSVAYFTPESYKLTLELSPDLSEEGIWTPPVPPFTGDTFMGMLSSSDNGAGATNALFFGCDSEHAPGGWGTGWSWVGPVGTPPNMMVTADVVVRIHAAVQFATVAGSDGYASFDVTVNGGSIGSASASHPGGLGYWSDTLTVDLHDILLHAGDVIGVTSLKVGWLTGSWQNVGTDGTFLRVGRGTFTWGISSVWVGP